MSERQLDHVKEYGRSLRLSRERNFSDRMCHDIASAVAREKFRLEPDEQKAVDEWLDKKYPELLKMEPPDQSGAPLEAMRRAVESLEYDPSEIVVFGAVSGKSRENPAGQAPEEAHLKAG